MKKLVWDASALINIKEPNSEGYSPAYSLLKDLDEGWIAGSYQNIIPAIAPFEMSSSVSRKLRAGIKILREFYIMGETEVIYPVDKSFLKRCARIVREDGFNKLRGADLIYACIAALESATLITKDRDFNVVADRISVIDLNESIERPNYLNNFELAAIE